MTSPTRLDLSHTLSLVAFAPNLIGAVMIAMIALAPVASAHAQPAPDGETARVIVHSGAPTTPAAARAIRRRIERAALTVCGGGDTSLAEVNRTVRASACWRDAVAGALAQVPGHAAR